jgi:hypothetical protein
MAQKLLELGTTHGAARTEQIALHFLADCPLVAGDYEEAETRYRRALAHARRSGLVVRCIDELIGIAMSAAGQGDAARAVRLAAAAQAQQEALGLGNDLWWGRMQEWFIGGARAQLSSQERQRAERSGTSISFDALLDEVLANANVGAA